jgi:transposase-like protein
MPKSSSYQDRARLRLARTPEFYRKFVAAYPKIGLPLSQYCRKHQVGESTFHKYKRAVRGTKGNSKVPIKTTLPRMLKIVPMASSPALTQPVEVLFPSGALLRLAHLDAETVAALRSLLFVAAP